MNKLIFFLFFPFIVFGQKDIERYKLYPTENIYTSILLDTQTGRLWQVSIRSSKTASSKVAINETFLLWDEEYTKQVYDEAIERWEKEYAKEEVEVLKPKWEDYTMFMGKVGQFKLYPTKNMYSFIMIDVIGGASYQVQWSTEEENRFYELISF